MNQTDPYIFVSHASADNARLRPVLLGLLEAGIPLWFDKPYHTSIKLPVSAFAGSIPSDKRWKDVINSALQASASMLVFPSASALHSHEVAREVGQGEARRDADPEQYAVVTAILAERDFAAEAKLTDGLHAHATTTSKADNGDYHLTPEGVLELNRLAEFLRTKIAGARARKTQTRPRAAAPVDYHIPFLVDRTTQLDHVHLALGGGGHPVLVLKGRDVDAPGRFLSVTLARRVLPGHARTKQAAESLDMLRVRWPSVPVSDHESFAHCLALNIGERFQIDSRHQGGVAATTTEARLERLAAAFAANGVSRIVAARFTAVPERERATEEAIAAWAKFWAAFPLDIANATTITVLPVLEIVSEPTPSRRVLDWRALMGRRRAGRSRPPAAMSAGIRLCVLPDLADVTTRCVRDWIDTDILFAAHADNVREQLSDDLTGLLEAHPNRGSMPMKHWATGAAAILIEAGLT